MDETFAIESEYEIGYKILPEKIHKNDVVIIEVYKTIQGQVSLEKIQDLKVESLDKSIIDVLYLEETHEYKILVKLMAMNKGETFLYVFVEGLPSLEIPITIYENNLPKHISLDIFPSILDVEDNNQGILSVLLTDENGIPIKSDKDYLIKLSTSKTGVISFDNSNIIISKGDIGITQTFTSIKPGIITITAKTGDLESSELVTVEEKQETTIEVSIIPKSISSFTNSNGHLIAQLFSDGELTKATEDISVYFEFSSNSTALNSSSNVNELNPIGYFQINKGQTWGHIQFSIQKGVANSYNATITSNNPLVVVEKTFDTIDVEMYGDKEIKFEALSVLADGNRQLIGIIYLEDSNGHPVIANRDIAVQFIASDESVSIETSIIKNGFGSAPVYGNMGYFVPSDKNISLKTTNFKLVELDIHGFEKDLISMKTHMFTDTIPNGEQQEIIVYMESSDGNLFKIPENTQIKISESEIFRIDKNGIKKFPYFVLIPIIAVNTGDEDLIISSDEFETIISLSSTSLKPDSLSFDYSEKLFNGIKDNFVIQILNSQGLPVEIDESIKVKIFSSDPSIIDFPKEILISPKSSFTKLEIVPKTSGTAEISLVSEGLPVLTEEITIQEVAPSIQITGSNIVDKDDSFIISILVKQNGIPLQNADVTWELEGGISTLVEDKTGPTGEAVASIIAISNKSVKILATINNGSLQSASATKIVTINATNIEIINDIKSQNSFEKPKIGGIDPVMILIPALIGGIIIYIKKKKK